MTRIPEPDNRIGEAARDGGDESMKASERLLNNQAKAREAAGDQDAQSIREVTTAPAAVTRQLADAIVSLPGQAGRQARDAGESAAATVREIDGPRDTGRRTHRRGRPKRTASRREAPDPRLRRQERPGGDHSTRRAAAGVELGPVVAAETETRAGSDRCTAQVTGVMPAVTVGR